MKIGIDKQVLNKYPEAEIGYILAQVTVKKHDPFVERVKETLSQVVIDEGITQTNFTLHPHISVWRKLYEEDFLVKAKTYRSSLEALIKCLVAKKKLWQISNIVDLYNCCSILSLLPMGGYDVGKLSGDITIRYAADDEPFTAIGDKSAIETTKNHIVYADEQKVLCWLWNHKDSCHSCIDEKTKEVLFFIDSLLPNQIEKSLLLTSELLQKAHCNIVDSGMLNKIEPAKELIT